MKGTAQRDAVSAIWPDSRPIVGGVATTKANDLACSKARTNSQDVINGLKHMADDHPCCKPAIFAAVQKLNELENNKKILLNGLNNALDELWKVHGNGHGTELEKAIAEIQTAISINDL